MGRRTYDPSIERVRQASIEQRANRMILLGFTLIALGQVLILIGVWVK